MAGRGVAQRHEAGQEIAEHKATRSENMLAMILEAARDPAIDASKFETMTRLAMELQDREKVEQFNRDLAAAIIEMPRITKAGKIEIPAKDNRPARTQGTYGKYEDLDRVVKPILASHNIVLRFRVGHEGTFTTVTPILMHTNGHTDVGEPIKVPAETSGSKNNAQAVGSAETYGQRYAAKAALNIVFEGEDTDARTDYVPSDPLIDWQARALEAAEHAHDQGGPEAYQKWFEGQPTRVRAWLVQSGNHGQFGGGTVAIPPPSPSPPPPSPPPSPPPKAEDPPAEQKRKPAMTPEQWVKTFKDEVSKIRDADQLNEYMDRKRDALDRLRQSHPSLWEKAQSAFHFRRDAIADGRLV